MSDYRPKWTPSSLNVKKKEEDGKKIHYSAWAKSSKSDQNK